MRECWFWYFKWHSKKIDLEPVNNNVEDDKKFIKDKIKNDKESKEICKEI